MALAHSQLYSFYHWKRPYDGGANKEAPREWWYEMKEAFLAGGWTLMGSYFGSGSVFNDGDRDLVDGVGGGAGTDTWSGELPTSNNRAWVVLQCPPAMGVFQVLFYASNTTNANPEYWSVRVSPLGQFMAINGGADGGINSEPTAPDSYTHYSTVNNGINSNGNYSLNLHACWSADKSQFFLMTNQEAGNAQFFAFSVLNNAPVALENSFVWCILGLNDITLQYDTQMGLADHYTAANWRGVIAGNVEPMYLGGRGWANSSMMAQMRIPSTKLASPGPCELYPSAVTLRGYHGTIPDLYYIASSHYQKGFGDAVGGPIKWYCGDVLILPWDSAEPLPAVR